MQVRYGTYPFEANACAISTSQTLMRNQGGLPYSIKRRFSVQEGYLYGDSQADLTAKIIACKLALAVPYQDIVLLRDDGSLSADVMLNFNSISGVMVTEGPDFPDSMGAEYANRRKLTFTAEAEYPLDGTNFLLQSWKETLSYSGGGPTFIHRPSLNGPPQKQMVYAQTAFKVVQSGQAVGYRGYPTVPPPIFPAALMMSPDIRRMGPTRQALGYQDFAIEWTYTFESIAPLVGFPNLWPDLR